MLVSTDPARVWRPADLAQALYISDPAAREQFEKLVAGGFLTEEEGGCCRYRPDEKTAATVAELTVAYGKWRVSVIEYIYSRPAESIYGFARAFKIKGDKDE